MGNDFRLFRRLSSGRNWQKFPQIEVRNVIEVVFILLKLIWPGFVLEILSDLFILEDASKLLIPHIEDQFVGFVIYHSSALRNSFIDLAACSARDLLLHVV